jgi:hypothetical protein
MGTRNLPIPASNAIILGIRRQKHRRIDREVSLNHYEGRRERENEG